MSAEQFIQQKAAAAILAIYGTEVAETSLQVSVTRKEFEGDYTLVTFPLLKITRQAPDATGNAIGEWLVANVPEISAFNSVKGFLNLSFSPVYWNESLQAMVSEESFGQLPSTGKRIMVEFSSPNTNKPLHLGHIRNNLLGDSVSRILKACGNEVIKATLVNDRGVHICKSMYAWEKLFNGATPESTGKKGDHLVGDCYVAYAKMEKEHPEIIDEVHKMLVDWEAGDPHVRELWSMMNGWVFKGFDETYKALGISFDKVDYEHDTYLLGKELVQKGLDMGVFVKDPDGSVWCDLTADGLDQLNRARGTISAGKGRVYTQADRTLADLTDLAEVLKPAVDHIRTSKIFNYIMSCNLCHGARKRTWKNSVHIDIKIRNSSGDRVNTKRI